MLPGKNWLLSLEMALSEMNGDGSEQEEGGCQEPDVIARGNILESFAESQEIRGLINSLKGIYGDLGTREVTIEKFIGKFSWFEDVQPIGSIFSCWLK